MEEGEEEENKSQQSQVGAARFRNRPAIRKEEIERLVTRQLNVEVEVGNYTQTSTSPTLVY